MEGRRSSKKRPKSPDTSSNSSTSEHKSKSGGRKKRKGKSKVKKFRRIHVLSSSSSSDVDVSEHVDASERKWIIIRTPTKTSKKINNHEPSESDDDNSCETRTRARSPIAGPSPNCKSKRLSDSGLSEDKTDSCEFQDSPAKKRGKEIATVTSSSGSSKSGPDTDDEPVFVEEAVEFIPDFEEDEIEIPFPEEQELEFERRESTSSSDSASDAENELDVNNAAFPAEDDALLEVVALDDDNFDAYVQHVPILQDIYRLYEKHLEVRVHSRTEFSVEMFVEHYQTSTRIHQYTPAFIEAFRLIDRRYWRYDQGQDKFVITLTKVLYDFVMRTLNHLILDLENLDWVLESVFNVLAFYQPLNNDANLRRIPGYSEYMAKLDDFSANSSLQILHHQREAISFAISRKGRCMLADEKRMGKGVEAIFSSYFYRKEWPMIIICPTSLQSTWKSELVKWLPREENHNYDILNLSDVNECQALASRAETDLPDVVIIGYALLQKSADVLKELKFKVMILDESHRIKHAWTTTTKSAMRLIKRSKRRFLLTSNPAFGVPVELFRQLHVINRSYFENYIDFSDRYCGIQTHIDAEGRPIERASTKWSDAKNLRELQHLLFGTVAIRTCREDLDVNLPIKIREKVFLNFDPDLRTRRILGEIYNRSKLDLDDILDKQSMTTAKIFIWYKKSGSAKVLEICKYLDQFDLKKKKTIIYARHINVLEGIEKLLEVKRIGYVRITGDYETRKDLCQKFNEIENNRVRVALLSMGISDVSVKLHTADTVIFTELYWVPDDLLRNEERAFKQFKPHKDGEKKKIDVKYLIASNPQNLDLEQIHIDTHLWEILAGKMHVLQELGLVRNDFDFTNMPEIRFEPVHSNVIDDLTFPELSSGGSDSNEEYNPEDDSEADRPSSTDSDSAVDSNEEESSEALSPSQADADADSQEKSPEPEESQNSEILHDDLPDTPIQTPPSHDSEEESPGTSSKPKPKRVTRSHTEKTRETLRRESRDTDSNSKSSEDSSEEMDEAPARPRYERINDDSDRSSEDETDNSLDSFVDKSGDDGDSESEDREYTPKKKKGKKSKKTKNKTVSFPRTRDKSSSSTDGSSDEYTGEEYRKTIKKQSKSFFL